MNRLKFTELEVGMKVRDNSGYTGTIKKCKNIHNISVKFQAKKANFKTGGTDIDEDGGYGFYCLDPECQTMYDPLYKAE
jgi:hypothetical protein